MAQLDVLHGPAAAPAGATTTLFTAATKTRVDEVIVCNTSPNATVFQLSIVREGEVSATGNRIARSEAIEGHTTLHAHLKQILEPGDFISVTMGAATTVNFTISGTTGLP